MLRFTTLALILAGASPAHADDLVEKYRYTFQRHAGFTFEVARTDPSGVGIDKRSSDECAKDIAKAKVEGLPADTVFTLDVDGKDKKVAFADLQQTICAPYERAYRIAQVAHAIGVAQDRIFWLTQVNMYTMDAADQATFLNEAKDCMDAAAQVESLGIGDRQVLLHNENGNFKIALDEAKEKVCEPLAKSAKAFAKDVKKAADEHDAEKYGPFKKAGIGGDKLEICGSYYRSNIRGVGGGVLSPAQIKKAKILFVRMGPATDTGLYSVSRFVFNGDKLVSSTEKNYVTVPGAGAFK